MRRIGFMTAVLFFVPWAVAGRGVGADVSPPRGDVVSSAIERRVVKVFDFDERRLGNYEELPMNWRRMTGPGFPRFLVASFDDEVGHPAAPSFRMVLHGGSVGAYYEAREIPVHPGSDYRITAWIRSSGLVHARALTEAYFLDHAMQKIAGSTRCSAGVGGPLGNETWIQVEVNLPGGFEDAAWIGLAVQVEQPPEPTTSASNPRPIHHRDVHASVWFDDVTVMRLPKTLLTPLSPGGVFLPKQPVQWRAVVEDPDGVGLTAELNIIDACGVLLTKDSVPVVRAGEAGGVVSVEDLPAGFYTARLSVSSGELDIAHCERSFLRLGAAVTGAGGIPPDRSTESTQAAKTGRQTGRLGIIADASAPADRRLLSHLVRALPISAVRIPFWRAETDDAMVVHGDSRNDAWLRALEGQDAAVVATLVSAPESLAAGPGGARRTLTEVLASPPDEWRPYLALTLARYGTHVRAWQLGFEESGGSASMGRLEQAVANFRDELRPLIGSPDVVVSLPAIGLAQAPRLPADVLSIAIPAHLDADGMTQLLAGAKLTPPRRWWIELETGDEQRYARRARLAEFAQRAVVALYHGPELVFVPQPWQVRTEGSDTIVTPSEELILLRTLGQALSGLEPAAAFMLDQGVQARLFVDETNTTGAIIAWTDGDGRVPRTVVADVGPEARRLDLWANATEPPRTDSGSEFSVDWTPIVISPVPAARGRMLAALALDNPTLQAAVDRQERTMRLSNPLRHVLRGRLKLMAPSDWRVEPQEFAIDLAPGETAALPVYFQVPINQAIGDYSIAVRFISGVDDLGALTVRVPLHVESSGLDVSVLTRADGRGLTILQRITNLTEDSLNLRTFLIATGTPPDERLAPNLAPGQTTVQEYHLANARRFAGQCIRVTAQQIDGPLCNNQVIRLD